MLVNVLELEDTTLVKPKLELSWVRNKTHVWSAGTMNMEATHHSLFELLVVSLD